MDWLTPTNNPVADHLEASLVTLHLRALQQGCSKSADGGSNALIVTVIRYGQPEKIARSLCLKRI